MNHQATALSNSAVDSVSVQDLIRTTHKFMEHFGDSPFSPSKVTRIVRRFTKEFPGADLSFYFECLAVEISLHTEKRAMALKFYERLMMPFAYNGRDSRRRRTRHVSGATEMPRQLEESK